MFKYILLILFLSVPSINSALSFRLIYHEERCLLDEFFEDSVFFIKHKIFSSKKTNLAPLLPYLVLNVYDHETGKNIVHEYIKEVKGKHAIKAPKSGLYKICVFLNRPRFAFDWDNDILFFNFKITSSAFIDDEPFKKAIKSEDVDAVKVKANEILRLTRPIIEFQNDQLETENVGSKETLANTRTYKYMTFGQLIMTLIIGAIQVNNFIKFLRSLHIISG